MLLFDVRARYISKGLTNRKRNGGEHEIRIIISLGFDQTFRAGTITSCRAVNSVVRKQIGISTRERNRAKSLDRGLHPLLVPLLLSFIRWSAERGEDLDENMIAPKTERGRLDRNARSGTPEFVGKDGTTWRDDSLH